VAGERSRHYVTNPAYVSAHLVPQLQVAFGARWWLVFGLAGAGIVVGLISASSVASADGGDSSRR